MKGNNGLKELEKRTYLRYQGDGLVDLGLGMVILLFGLGMAVDQTLLAPIFAAVAYPVWLAAKKGITEKRLGFVEFSEARKKKERSGIIYLCVLGCVVFLLGIGMYTVLTGEGDFRHLFQAHGYLALGLIFGILASSIGLVLGLGRLHAYALLVMGSVTAGHFLHWPLPAGIILPGSVIIFCGTLLLLKFIRKYPVPGAGNKGGLEA